MQWQRQLRRQEVLRRHERRHRQGHAFVHPHLGAKTKNCTANVQLAGAVRASWSREATTSTGGYEKNASYTTSKDGVTVAVLSAAKKMRATPIVTKDGVTYTVQPKSGVVKADKKGGGAEVDAKATVLEDGKIKTVNVKATFDC